MQVATQFVDDPTRVVNRMTVAAPNAGQPAVRIAEVARNVDRQLGIRWSDVERLRDQRRPDRLIGGGGVSGDGAYSIGARR